MGSLRWDERTLFYWKAVMEVTQLEGKKVVGYLVVTVLKM